MKKALTLVVAGLFAIVLWASDPWKDKSYKDWDQKDLHQIMNESPWAKKIEIKAHGGLEAPEGAPTAGGAPGANEEKEGPGGEEDEENEKGEMTFVVRWISSRTLREASARSEVLQGRIMQAEIDKHIPPESDDYQLVVVGSNMTMFQKTDESALQSKSYITPKKSKQKIAPTQVEIVRMRDGKKIGAIVFHFPKKTKSGERVIADDEKELNFVARAGTVEIKTGFDPQKMVDKQGKDL
jgi:hypothetical protein